MKRLSPLKDVNNSIVFAGSVGFFIYDIESDIINIADNTKRLLGLINDKECTLSTIKSLIIGIDIPVFLQQFRLWLNGDTSGIIQVRIVDVYNQLRTIQIKGHARYEQGEQVKSIYGAYFDVSVLGN
jgi:hypothetical protein